MRNGGDAERFTGKAATYAKYRPDYPAELFDYLRDSLGLGPGWVVADAGSGTGIFSGQLLRRGVEVFGVEPNAEMRREAERQLAGEPLFTSVAGCAEATTLPDASVDLVTAAQSFHWFDPERFRRECRRILRRTPRALVVWNSRDETCPLVRENAEICRRYCPEFRGFFNGAAPRPRGIDVLFASGWQEVRFSRPRRFDLESFLGRNFSASYAPSPESDAGREFADALRKLFDRYSEPDGRLTMPAYTYSYCGPLAD